jgi:hypothetical protein
MRPWLLSCLVLAGCAGARSAGTPTGSLDAEGFRTLMERVAAGRIARWREYQTESSLTFEELSAATRF